MPGRMPCTRQAAPTHRSPQPCRRYACDVLTLRDQSTATLALLYLRREEIAAVVVNPLCGLLSAPAPAAEGAEPAAAEGDAACGDAAATPYGVWLAELRAACTRAAIPLIFDEASTGFRVAAGGAQQHFGVEADIVCFGHTLGDGLPVGAVCGSAAVLASSEPHLPLRKGVEGGEGGVADHPALMASVLGHLKRLQREPGAFAALHARVAAWGAQTNAELAAARLPLRLACAASVWSLRFEAAGRYHWVLQPLLREEGVQLAWLAPGHLGFALDTSEAELDQMSEAILRAARRMRTDGWWPEPTEVAPQTDAQARPARLRPDCDPTMTPTTTRLRPLVPLPPASARAGPTPPAPALGPPRHLPPSLAARAGDAAAGVGGAPRHRLAPRACPRRATPRAAPPRRAQTRLAHVKARPQRVGGGGLWGA